MNTIVPDRVLEKTIRTEQENIVKKSNPNISSDQQQEQVEKRMTYIDALKNEKYYPLKDYVENKSDANVTDTMKSVL